MHFYFQWRGEIYIFNNIHTLVFNGYSFNELASPVHEFMNDLNIVGNSFLFLVFHIKISHSNFLAIKIALKGLNVYDIYLSAFPFSIS